jgi:hypothetical protein
MPLRPGKSIDMHTKSVLKEVVEAEDRLVTVNVPFRWRLNEQVTKVWSHLTFPAHLISLAQKFKNEHVGDRKMIGVHLRHLEGKCKNRAKGYAKDKFMKEAGLSADDATRLSLVFCDTNHEIVEQIASAHGLDINDLANVVVFVASDGQRPDLIETFTSKGGVVVSKSLAESLGSGPSPIVLDMILLTMSDLFIGSPYSTLAVNVRDYRIGNDKGLNWLGLENPFIFVES